MMPIIDKDVLERKMEELASVIGAPKSLLPAIGTANDFAYPYVLIDDLFFQYVVRQKSEALEHRETRDIEQLLYWIFRRVTWNMASDFERTHRVPGQDFRRLLFSHQLSLLEALRPEWQAMEQQEIDRLLVWAAFVD